MQKRSHQHYHQPFLLLLLRPNQGVQETLNFHTTINHALTRTSKPMMHPAGKLEQEHVAAVPRKK